MVATLPARTALIGAVASLVTVQAAAAQSAGAAEPANRTISFTTDECTYCTFDISPDGRWIVFDLLGQLWRIPVVGGEAVPLTDAVRDTADYRFPAISPDGRQIVFVAERPGGRGLATIPLKGGDFRWLSVAGDSEVLDSSPAWAPDGRSLAFIRDGRIRVRDVDSGQEWAIETAGAAPLRALDLTWSPSATRIAFSSEHGIWWVDPLGGPPEPLLQEGILPAFSPDGSRIAFLADDEEGRLQVWTWSVDGGQPRQLTASPGVASSSLRWTPDGMTVVYWANGRLWGVSPHKSDPIEIPFSAAVRFERHEITPRPVRFPEPGSVQQARGHMGLALSPDGSRIAVIALSRLWVFAPGEEPESVTAVLPTAAGLTWAPDGREVAWSAGRGGEEDLFATDVRSGETRQLTRLPGMAIKPSWSPDGSRIAFVHWTIPAILPRESGSRRPAQLRHIASSGATVDRLEDTEFVADVDVRWTFRGGRYTQEIPQWSPDAYSLLLWNQRFPVSDATAGPVTVETLPERMPFLQWVDEGSLVFVDNVRLVTVEFAAAMNTASSPEILSDDAALFVSSSRGGDLLYLSADGLRLRRANGAVERLGWPLVFRTPAAPHPLLIRGARVIPGDGSPALPPQDVLVQNGRISAMTPAGSLPLPEHTRIVEAEGKTLIPGLIDMHSHLWMDSALPTMLYAGVTTTRDLGSPVARLAGFRDAQEAGLVAAPRLLFGALQFSIPFNGFSGDGYVGPFDAEGIGRAISILGALGAHHLKWRPERYVRQAWDLLSWARQEGFTVSGHPYSLPLIAGGMSGKEHPGRIDYNDIAQLFASAGFWLVPTIVQSSQHLRVMDDHDLIDGELPSALVDPFLRYLIRADADPQWRQEREAGTESARRRIFMLHRHGATVLAGSDAPGQLWALHWEMEEFVAAGLSPLEALTAATGASARALGAGAEIGTIEEGKWADLILLDADPLEDIRNTQKIRKVIQGGRVVDREALLDWARESRPMEDQK